MRNLLAVVLLLTIGGAAHAADLRNSVKDVQITTVEPAVNWTGPWIGAFAGYSMSNTELSLDHFSGEKSYNYGKLDGLGGEGLFGELQGGYDRQIDQMVLGCFGGVNLSGAETTMSVFDGAAKASIEEDTGYTLGCRAGVLINPTTLFYAAAGWRWEDLDVTVTAGDERFSKSFDRDGLFGEIGLESHIQGGLFGRLATRYTAFDDQKYVLPGGDEYCRDELKSSAGKLEIMAGVTYKFNVGN